MLLPVLVASLLLCIPPCWSGDPCPSKSELKFCTCRHFSLMNGQIPHHRRRRQIIPSSVHPSTATSISIPSIKITQQDITSTPSSTSVTKILTSSSSVTEIEFDDDIFDGLGLGIMGRSRGIIEEIDESKRDQFTSVECREPKTITEFEEVLLFALHRRLVDKLIVANLPPFREESLSRFPSRGLRNTRIKQLEIRDTALSGDFIWYGDPFEGQSHSLLRFAANRCYLYGALTYEEPGTINTKGLHQLPRIEVLDFSSNHLTIIKATAFKNPPANLSSITLSRNSLQTLEAGCFSNISQLKIVDLSSNLLKTVIRSIFATPAKFLESINLSGNFIENLPTDFFANMSALRIVNLSKNFLHNMPGRPWATVWRQLTSVDVSGNFIECDCHLLWLLPILSSPPRKGSNSSVSSHSLILARQTVKGWCNYNRMPNFVPRQYALISLTRDKLMCR